MTHPVFVFLTYPLSQAYRAKVDEIVGPGARYLMLAELRIMGFLGMIRFLRQLGPRAIVYIPLEDSYSEALLPALLAVATVSSAQDIILVTPSAALKVLNRLRLTSSIAKMVTSTVAGAFALIRSWFEVRWLLRRCVPAYQKRERSNEVLYLNANLWFGVRAGGSVGHIAGVINGLTDSGSRVHLITANSQVMLRSGIEQTLLAAPATFGFPYELNYFRYNRHVIRSLRSLPTGRYGLLYQRMSVMNYAGVVLSRRLGIPLVLEYNGSEVWVAKNWGRALRFSALAIAMEDLCLQHAYRIVVVSEALKEELIGRGVDADKIVYYPNCVDPEHYNAAAIPKNSRDEARTAMNIGPKAVLAMFVGTFGQWHGATVLAHAIKQLVDEHREWLESKCVRFAMIGDGLKMPEVKALIGGEPYRRWVAFTGLIPQARTVAYLAAADILISPHVSNSDGSKFFGSPTKLFEYMAMGKGIIASDLDQIGQVLAGGLRIWESSGTVGNPPAILARPGNVDDLIACIQLLVEDATLRDSLGRNARAEVLLRYTWRHHVAEILNSLADRHQITPHSVPGPSIGEEALES